MKLSTGSDLAHTILPPSYLIGEGPEYSPGLYDESKVLHCLKK
ncbi:MAG TPA: hypothetical protein VMG34_10120 [Bacteroidota bacterium]|nr:hypothetical protein [Bacteroidota bacterium]